MVGEYFRRREKKGREKYSCDSYSYLSMYAERKEIVGKIDNIFLFLLIFIKL